MFKYIAIVALAVLACFGAIKLFSPISALLTSKSLTVELGHAKISILSVLEVALYLCFLFVACRHIDRVAQARISKMEIRATSKELLQKFLRIVLASAGFLIGLRMLGIDLTTFMVFGSAIFVGVGLGLQKLVANFIAGIAILLDKTCEMGDVIELEDGVIGTVKKIAARYTLIEAMSGKSIIVPNENFMLNKVVNWTHTNNKVRVEIRVDVSDAYDFAKVVALLLEAASRYKFSAKFPPSCQLKSVYNEVATYTVKVWIEDGSQGVGDFESDVRIAIWKHLKTNGINSALPNHTSYIVDQR